MRGFLLKLKIVTLQGQFIVFLLIEFIQSARLLISWCLKYRFFSINQKLTAHKLLAEITLIQVFTETLLI